MAEMNPLCGRWMVGEKSLSFHCMGSGYYESNLSVPSVWEVDV
jgi:hypothetical protein